MAEQYTLEKMLEQVNNAISTVLAGGQSYRIGSRSLTRADLSMLKSMRDDIIAQMTASADSSLMSDVFVAYFDGR
jgi:hypothetical protein